MLHILGVYSDMVYGLSSMIQRLATTLKEELLTKWAYALGCDIWPSKKGVLVHVPYIGIVVRYGIWPEFQAHSIRNLMLLLRLKAELDRLNIEAEASTKIALRHI